MNATDSAGSSMRYRARARVNLSWPLRARIVCWGLGLATTSLSCNRRAPGPDECREFAARLVGVKDESQLTLRSVRERYLVITRECLTTPYDRELLRCTEMGQSFRSCQAHFQMRRRLKQEQK